MKRLLRQIAYETFPRLDQQHLISMCKDYGHMTANNKQLNIGDCMALLRYTDYVSIIVLPGLNKTSNRLSEFESRFDLMLNTILEHRQTSPAKPMRDWAGCILALRLSDTDIKDKA